MVRVDRSRWPPDNEGSMEVTLALLADAANVSREGKLNILGAFGNINANKFPIRHPEMRLVLRLEASPAEAGMQKKFEVKVLDVDGQQVGGIGGEFNVPSPPQTGRRIQMQTALRITDAIFPKEGDYIFAVLIDNKTEAEIPLSLTLIKEGEENGN